jgi:hypothetical protein
VLTQLLTILGTLGGAVLGLLAPLVTSRLARRDRDIEVQRQIASDIMALFEGDESPLGLLVPEQSRPRRQLYILGLRLDSKVARRACMTVIALAGQSPYDEGKLLEAWNVMMNEIGSVYRNDSGGRGK